MDGIPPIALDAMGGDNAPGEIVAGAVAAVRDHGVPVVLVGSPRTVSEALAVHDAVGEIPIVRAEEAIAMDEGALASLRRPRSSIAVACHLVRRGDASAVVSAGSTAGVVATGKLRLRAQQGVLRPAIAVPLPTRPHPTVLLDAGATADVKPETLVQFAHLGAAYAETALDLAAPRVGLLTIGGEAEKGNKLTKRAHELLAAAVPSLNFTGNVEGHDLLNGVVDVIVTDGFTGNIALKTMEGAVRYAFSELRETLEGGHVARLAAALQRRRLRDLRKRLDPEVYGGAVLLGLNGTVVIAHGASTAKGVTAACVLALNLARQGTVAHVGERIAAGHKHRRW
ncbi:phosphate acyltransferase [Sphaerisporangium siamense]|uniref:Phosphate acyltransferase n=2 Tax=Sphaerisporangium siamense TaxID=795645 RepID=A0A7W7G9C3_9ACTN|nr:phosphate acyltransferase PlsX [Sphaerisporangium siamense]MBB4700419.1 glycerol-3-phosphate acyltransferase PlsX [Sphaerisporangium siamense]GII88419.1 phosphate acyltransferase [Sphaerisporangium siamense]